MYTRRELFLGSLKLVVLLPLAACSSNDTPQDCKTANQVTNTSTMLTVTSSCNGGHTHDFDVAAMDLSSPPPAGVSGESTPYADDGHTHTVTLTMAQLAQIQSGTAVTVTSGSTLSHTHTFTFHTS